MTKAKKLSVGVRSPEARKVRDVKIALGEYMCPPNKPRRWFDPITSYVT